MARALTPDLLRRLTDPAELGFDSTADVAESIAVVGQERAMAAIRFGTDMTRRGYNLFLLGPPGIGKHSLLGAYLAERAATEPVPQDLCYVYNFTTPHQPRALRLPPGIGQQLQRDMELLVEEIQPALARAFESEEFRARSRAIEQEFKSRQEGVFGDLQARAAAAELAMLNTPMGIGFAPRKGNEVLPPEEFQQLPEADRQRIQHDIEGMEEALRDALQQMPRWERESREKLRDLAREVSGFAVSAIMEDERQRYAELPEVLAYFDDVQRDVVANVRNFTPSSPKPKDGGAEETPEAQDDGAAFVRRYRVNVLVNHADLKGAPVVYEDNPTFVNLFGRVEYMAQMGTLITDFNLIKPGALHRANGGYLMLDAVKVLTQPFAWDALKRALYAHEVRIESLAQVLSTISTTSLEPEPTPLAVKVALIGDRQLYYLVSALDPDFAELFKVAADFDEDTDRNPANTQVFARLLAVMARREGLRPFHREAVARVIDNAVRQANDADKLSTRMHSLGDLLSEADYWASQRGSDVVGRDDVQQAINAQEHRLSRVRNRLREQILRGTVLVDTTDERVGQINGLTVMQLGDYMFGQPARITARVWLGKGDVVDIEREVNLSGPIHSKGVLILRGFLNGRYAADHPLSLSASLVFEQSYGGVEGDSAAAAELYALLSAIGEVPIRQSVAITGSVNQHGQIQAIGGVNEKIEGFFDVCQERGLTGQQGVIIPESNVKHLMLRPDVVAAVAAGQFHVHAIRTIDEGVPLLMGLEAGELGADGQYPADTLNARVARRLAAMAERRRAFAVTTGASSTEGGTEVTT